MDGERSVVEKGMGRMRGRGIVWMGCVEGLGEGRLEGRMFFGYGAFV